MVRDSVTNLGNRRTPHMLLYHCNFGYPLVDDGTRIIWKDAGCRAAGRATTLSSTKRTSRDSGGACRRFPNYDGDGEAVAFIDVDADRRGTGECGLTTTTSASASR